MPVQCCDLTGKVAVVTGASQGIGKTISQRLAKCGGKIILVARNTNALDAVKESILNLGGEAEVQTGDVSTTDSFVDM